jgi:signal transduction histidine kinase
MGMDSEALNTVFEPFQKVGANPEQGMASYRLGLPIAKTLMELLGGTLRLESKVGVGTTATLTLPLDLPETSSPD